jgi:hypothetical protein
MKETEDLDAMVEVLIKEEERRKKEAERLYFEMRDS